MVRQAELTIACVAWQGATAGMRTGHTRCGVWLLVLTWYATAAAVRQPAKEGKQAEQAEVRLRTATVDAITMADTAPGQPGEMWLHATAMRRAQRSSSAADSSV